MELNVIINGEALEELKKLPSDSIDCCITSPPYWALRSYGVAGQLGLEKDFKDYINKLCDIFDEVRRILKPTGTCFVNIGDTYYTKSCSGFGSDNRFNKDTKASGIDVANKIRGQGLLPHKCLVQIPSRFGIEMVNRGWILRNRIIWYKPSCMPSSTKDRFTNDYEDLFFFTKYPTYFFDTQYEPLASSTIKRYQSVIRNGEVYDPNVHKTDPTGYAQSPMELLTRIAKKGNDGNGRIKRAVWAINPQRSKTNHFATFPEKLIEVPIKAGCPEFVCNKCGVPRQEIVETNNPEGITGRKGKAMVSEGGVVDTAADGITRIEAGHNPCVYSTAKHVGYTDCGCSSGFSPGVVLDPFMGAGTTGLVAAKQGKRYIGIELNPEYIKLAEQRIHDGLQPIKTKVKKHHVEYPENPFFGL